MVQPRGSRGSVLLIALIVVVLIGGLSAAFVSMSFSQSKTTFNASEGESSINMAESGLDDCINKLNALVTATWKGDDTSTNAGLVATPASAGNYVIATAITDTTLDYYAMNKGTYNGTTTTTSYTGTVNRGTFDVSMTPAYKGRGTYTITTHGYHGKEKKGLSAVVTASAGNNIGDYGLVGKVTLTATSSNVFVDSFKSSKGSYASQATNTDSAGNRYALENGNLGSNGDIDVKNGMVHGSATPGPTSTVTIGNATVTGATTPATAALDIPSQPFNVPKTILNTPMTPKTWGNGTVSMSGPTSSNALAGGSSEVGGKNGVYYYSDAVTKGSNAGISINGNVTLYVDGDIGMNANEPLTFETADSTLTIYQKSGSITMNGQTYPSALGVVTPTSSSLQIYSASTGDIKFNGGSTVYASVYAPDAAFRQTGTSTFYGRMVASTIDIGGNMTFHRDEDLNNGPTVAPVYKIKSVNETNF